MVPQRKEITMNRIRVNTELRDLVYTLRQEFGECVDLYQRVSINPNYISGNPGIQEKKIKLPKVPVLTGDLARDFLYNRAYMVANKNFTYGAYMDEEHRTIIIDAKYLPQGYVYNADDFCIIRGNRYKVKNASEIDDNKFIVLVVNRLTNQAADPIYDFTDKIYIKENQ